jgi:hypothetical protein
MKWSDIKAMPSGPTPQPCCHAKDCKDDFGHDDGVHVVARRAPRYMRSGRPARIVSSLPSVSGGRIKDMRRRNARKEFIDTFAGYTLGQADGCWQDYDSVGVPTGMTTISETHEPGSHFELAPR